MTRPASASRLSKSAAARVRRGGLACVLLAGLAGYLIGLAQRTAPGARTAMSAFRRAPLPSHSVQRLRVRPEDAGVFPEDLVGLALRARNGGELREVTEKLGVVGNDESVDQLAPLLADHRRAFAEAVLDCYAAIGTEHAVAMLIDRLSDDRMEVRQFAAWALGQTHSAKAEGPLLALALKRGDPMQSSAIYALGYLQSDAAVAALITLSSDRDYQVANAAVGALGDVDTKAATAAIRGLIESPDTRIASTALLQIHDFDDALLARLAQLLRSTNAKVRSDILIGLPYAGERALPMLRAAAFVGDPDLRRDATTALGEIGGPAATCLLAEILNTGDQATASAAAAALAKLGDKASRDILISAALGDRAQPSGAVAELVKLDGEDVEQALRTVLKSGAAADRLKVLSRLVHGGDADALEVAIDLVRGGSPAERDQAMQLLADSGAPRAIETLLDFASKIHGAARGAALGLVATVRPDDPELGRLLRESLFSKRVNDVETAANILVSIGSRDAREMLLTALGTDTPFAELAARALGQLGLDDIATTALLSAAQRDPSLMNQVGAELLEAGAPEGLRLATQVFAGDDILASESMLGALATAGTPEAKQLIDRQLDAKQPEIRVEAIQSLLRNPDEKSTDSLLRLADDAAPTVREAAMLGLGKLGSPRAQAALFEAVRARDPSIRANAVEGLAQLNAPHAGAVIVQMMRDPDPNVVLAAISSSDNFGPDVDPELLAIDHNPRTSFELRIAAEARLRIRGTDESPSESDRRASR